MLAARSKRGLEPARPPVAGPARPAPYRWAARFRLLSLAVKEKDTGHDDHALIPRALARGQGRGEVAQYLRTELGVDQETFSALKARCPELEELSVPDVVEPCVAVLKQCSTQQRIKTLLRRSPAILSVPLGAWSEFMGVFGFTPSSFVKLLEQSPEVGRAGERAAACTPGPPPRAQARRPTKQGSRRQPTRGAAPPCPVFTQVFTRSSLFAAGTLIQQLKALGLADNVIVAATLRFPELLATDPQGAVQVLEFLYQLGLSKGWAPLAGRLAGAAAGWLAARAAPRMPAVRLPRVDQLACWGPSAGGAGGALQVRQGPGEQVAQDPGQQRGGGSAAQGGCSGWCTGWGRAGGEWGAARPPGARFYLLQHRPGAPPTRKACPACPQVEVFTGELGFSGQQLLQLAEHDPGLLAADLAADTRPKLDFLRETLGLSRPQLQQVLAGDPHLLSNALPNLHRKWRFLQQEVGGGVELLLACPGYFSCNLMLVIGPRNSLVRQHGLGAAFSKGQREAGAGAGVASMQRIKASLGEALELKQQSSTWWDARHDVHRRLQSQQAAQGGVDGGAASSAGGVQRPELQQLLACSNAEFAARVGLTPEEWQEWVEEWVQTEGLQWSGVRA